MKIDKSNPRHWLYLVIFTINTSLALLARIITKKPRKKIVILYGHKLNGNLKAIHDYAAQVPDDITVFFLTMDPAYYRSLKKTHHCILSGLNPLHMLKLASASVLISDHGLHSLILFLKYSNMKFIDVWHGIPFKGFDAADFTTQHQYDEVWVTSEKLRQLYIGQFGFPENIVKVTGYARTDILISKKLDCHKIREKIGICNPEKKIILFAPTWQQDQKKRNIFPFDTSEGYFLETMEKFCTQHNAVCVLRKHLNSESPTHGSYQHIYHASSEQFPDTEEILLISDILICDWSSIAFDYLLLNRPTLFLDVEPPFKKGFSLDSSYRFGEIVPDMPAMLKSLENCLQKPENYQEKYAEKHENVTQILYGKMADSHVAARCFQRLLDLQTG